MNYNYKKNINEESHFDAICREYDLKPELKDIYLIAGRVIISIDGYRKIARRSCPDYFVKVIVVSEGDKVRIEGNEIKADITFKKMNKDNIIGAYAIASRGEGGDLTYKYVDFADFYVPGVVKNNEYVPSMWDKIPVAMISKVAESTILRMLCNELGGTYIPEEYPMDEQQKKLSVKNNKNEDIKQKLTDEEMNSKVFTDHIDRCIKEWGMTTKEVLDKMKAKYILTPDQEATILNLK